MAHVFMESMEPQLFKAKLFPLLAGGEILQGELHFGGDLTGNTHGHVWWEQPISLWVYNQSVE